jgi:putative nucleotidyltransferase with HDIG domain
MTIIKETKKPGNGHSQKKAAQAGMQWLRPYAYIGLMALLSALCILREPGIWSFTGSVLMAGVLLWLLYMDIIRYQPLYARKSRMLLLLGFMVVFTLSTSRGFEYVLAGMVRGIQINASGAEIYGIPVAAGAMLVMLLFDFHTAIVVSFMVGLLSGLWQGDPSFAVYAFVSSLTAAFSVVRCKRRTAILRGGILVLTVNLVTLFTILLYKDLLITAFASYAFMFSAVSVLFVVAIVSLMLPMLEKAFKVTTDISLLELLDLDHPLMKNLMISAPGTYHHSIIVGNLVESCAELVGVNPLLARVGAYYHDIGKAKMPEYFIENQMSGVNKHEKITPHMSSMILTSHVKEGVEMAEEHKLPEEVRDIIQQHHGNSLITYFYEKAKGEPGAEGPSEEVYRYPGPKPQSRTSALIMMADAVEAASRVLTDPTAARVNILVDKVMNHIFLTGQLEECELTFKDIYEIKARFNYILTGILHKRVNYPGFDFDKDRKGESQHIKQAEEDKAAAEADRERVA